MHQNDIQQNEEMLQNDIKKSGSPQNEMHQNGSQQNDTKLNDTQKNDTH